MRVAKGTGFLRFQPTQAPMQPLKESIILLLCELGNRIAAAHMADFPYFRFMTRVFYLALLIISFCPSLLLAQSIDAAEVMVLPIKDSLPAGARLIGHIKAGNNSTELHCDYEAVINEAKKKAKALGGNVVKITELRSPVFISGCYSIKADVYKVPDISIYKPLPAKQQILSQDREKYAVLYIYRLKDTVFPAARYTVYMDSNKAIFQSKSRNTVTIKLDKEQKITIWAKAGKQKELTLDVQYGHSYYLRCGIEHGNVLQNPVLELVHEAKGEEEYRKLDKGRPREKNPAYLNEMH